MTIRALGDERFEVTAGEDVRRVEGYDAARALAHELAGALGPALM